MPRPWILKFQLPIKRAELFRGMADSKAVTCNMQDEPSLLSCSAKNKKILKKKKKKKLSTFQNDVAVNLKWLPMSKAGISNEQNNSL